MLITTASSTRTMIDMKTLTQFIVYMVKWILAPVTITYIMLHDIMQWDIVSAFLVANVFWGVVYFFIDKYWLFGRERNG